jgi:mannose-6-phosphate isomerase-like protein (cupin superfamily)
LPHLPTSIANAEHYVWGTACDGWHLLDQADLSVIQERVPPNRGEVRHYHSKARQYFYVLKGKATLEFDGGTVTFGAGEGVHVPPGVAHRFFNSSTDVVEFLVVSSPPTRGDRTNIEASNGAA